MEHSPVADATYVPGSSVCMAGGRTWLLADFPMAHEVLGACWSLVGSDADPDEILGAILQAGFSVVSNFALASVREGVLRVILRGQARGVWTQASGATFDMTSEFAPTWREHVAPASAGQLSLMQGNPTGADIELPLRRGVVTAVRLNIPAHPSDLSKPGRETVDAHFAHADASRSDDAMTFVAPAAAAPAEGERSVIAAMPVAPPSPAFADRADQPVHQEPEDIDGELHQNTMSRAQLLAAHAPTGTHETGPIVLAARCPGGHLSPAHAGNCRVCRQPMPAQQPMTVPRPTLGLLRFSTGDVVTLDKGVVMGRAPQPPAGEGRDRPHVMQLPSGDRDISRTHAEVSLDGWLVFVEDLGSTNGTVVRLPGQPPIELRPHDPQLIEPGTAVSLTDEISFTFEVEE